VGFKNKVLVPLSREFVISLRPFESREGNETTRLVEGCRHALHQTDFRDQELMRLGMRRVSCKINLAPIPRELEVLIGSACVPVIHQKMTVKISVIDIISSFSQTHRMLNRAGAWIDALGKLRYKGLACRR